MLKASFKALRVHQWSKNVLVAIPAIASHQIFRPSTITATVVAFASFSLLASSVYIVNDILDVESDRSHPHKKKRPFASGELSKTWGIVLALILIAASAAVAAAANVRLLGWLGAYLALTLVYSLFLKRKLVVDVLALAILYTLRIAAGAEATQIVPSQWLMAFTMFLFFGLAMAKRSAELTIGGHKSSRAYRAEDRSVITSIGVAACFLAVLVSALYVTSPNVAALYSHPERLWLAIPSLLFWISRIWILTNRGEIQEDPVAFTLKDPASYCAAIGLAAALWIAV